MQVANINSYSATCSSVNPPSNINVIYEKIANLADGYPSSQQILNALGELVCYYNARTSTEQAALRSDPRFVKFFNFALLTLAWSYQEAGENQLAITVLEAFLGVDGSAPATSDTASGSEILALARLLPNQFPPESRLRNPLGALIGSYSETHNTAKLIEYGQKFISGQISVTDADLTDAGWNYVLPAVLEWANRQVDSENNPGVSENTARAVVQAQGRLRSELLRSQRMFPPNNGQARAELNESYTYYINILARAYYFKKDFATADKLIRAMLGMDGGTIPGSIAVSGLTLTAAPNDNDLKKLYLWNRINWAKAQGNVNELNAARQEVNNFASILSHLDREKMLESLSWGYIDCGQYNPAIEIAVLYLNDAVTSAEYVGKFTEVLISALTKRGGGLADKLTLAAVLKATLPHAQDGLDIPFTDPRWQEAQTQAGQNLGLNSLSRLADNDSTERRLQLASILMQIAGLYRAENDTERYERYLALSIAEYRACEEPLIREITSLQGSSNSALRTMLEKFLALASTYKNMGNSFRRSDNRDLADICFARAEAIYRLVLADSASHGVDPQAGIFDASQNILLDIHTIISKLNERLENRLSHHHNLKELLTGTSLLRALTDYSDLRIMSEMDYNDQETPEANLIRIRAAYDDILETLNSVITNTGTSEEIMEIKAQAQNAIFSADYAMAEAYIRAGRYSEAVQLFRTNIDRLLSRLSSASDVQRIDLQISLLGNVQGLAWAYGEMANHCDDTAAGRALARRYNLIAAAIYRALLYGQYDTSLSEVSSVLEKVVAIRSDLLSRLPEIDSSEGDLHLALAEKLKAAARTQDEAMLRDALAESDLATGEVTTVKAEIQVALHICLARQGKIEEASTLIGDAVSNASLALALNPTFRSLSALTWALGVRGGFLESKGNVAEAHQDFAHAAALYRALIYGQATAEYADTTAIAQRSAEFIAADKLEEMHITLADLQTTYADLLKASSKGLVGQAKLAALEEAASEYQKAPESLAARAGLAEVYVMLGEYYLGTDRAKSQQYYLDAMNLCEALLTAGELPATIKGRAAILKSITSLAWALNKLANLTQNPDYARAALGIYRKLLNISGNHLPEIDDLELNQVLDFIIANRLILLSPEVMEEAQLSLSGLLMGYIGTLRSVKDFSLALSEAERLLSQIPAQHSLYDERFRLNLMRTIAEINLFDLEDHDQAGEMFENIITEINNNEFGSDDPEINSILISAHRGLADIHLLENEVDAAITELDLALELTGHDPTGDNALQAARIHLALAAIYTEHLENEELARQQIVIAQALSLNPELSPHDALPIRAQAYYALGEIARRIDEDYEAAAAQYQAALALLNGSNEQDMLAQVHAALAFLRIAEDNFDAAESEVALAQASLSEDSSEGLIGMVDSAVEALRRGELDRTTYAQFGFAYQSNSFEGNDPQSSWPINFQLGTQLWQNLQLNFGYSYGPEHSTTYYDSASLEEMPRMSSTGHHLDFGVTYGDEYNNFLFKVNPYLAFDIYDYTINGYTHTSDYAHIIASQESGGTYFAATQGLNGELFYQLPLNLQLGLGAGISVTERSGTLPSQAAEQQTAEEFPSLDAPSLEHDPFLSWYLHPQVRWNGFSLGFRAGDSAYDVSEQAFWPLGNRDTMRYAATLGYNNLFTFGDDNRWFLNLGLGSEVGTHLYLTGSEGIGYVVSDDFIPQLIFTQSYFNDFSLDTSSYNLGLGLRINFDLTPGSDD